MRSALRLAACVVVVGTLAGCGGAEPPLRKTLVPRSCADPAFGVFPASQTTRATRGTRVGVNFLPGGPRYVVVDEVFVEVLRPDADLSVGDLAILEHRNKPVLSAKAKSFPAGDRTVAVTFEGVDSEGRALPPGKYPVVFAMGAHSDFPKCPGNAGASAIITTLDWRG